MKNILAILFFIKKNEPKRNGLCTIMVRITIDGEYIQFSTKMDADPTIWDQKYGKIKERTLLARQINKSLDRIQSLIYLHHRQLSEKYTLVRPIMVKKAFFALEDETTLGYQFKEQVKFFRSKAGKKISEGTDFRYKLAWKRIEEFLEKEYHVSDIQIEKINLRFLEKFYLFLRNEYNYSNNTAIKYMQHFSTIMKYAEKTGLILTNPFSLYTFHLDKSNPIFLLQHEIDRIWNKKLKTQRLTLVRDMFIFSCYTGLSFIDMCLLRKDDVQISFDDKQWIIIKRKKTDVVSYIPLLPIPLLLINKYKKSRNDELLFPMRTNQKTNEYLKEIADICHIKKNITFRISRHTFATLALKHGVSIESVSGILGHNNIKTTQIYARITPEKIGREMDKLNKNLVYNKSLKAKDNKLSQDIDNQKILEIAKKLKIQKLSNEQIADITDLSENIIASL